MSLVRGREEGGRDIPAGECVPKRVGATWIPPPDISPPLHPRAGISEEIWALDVVRGRPCDMAIRGPASPQMLWHEVCVALSSRSLPPTCEEVLVRPSQSAASVCSRAKGSSRILSRRTIGIKEA